MKKLTIIAGLLITTNAFAEIIIVSNHYYQSPGVKEVGIKTDVKTRTLSRDEINAEKNDQMQKSFSTSLQAAAHDAFVNVNQNVKVYSDHSACFKNTTNIMQ